jgi:hypothetical protein
MTLAPLLTSESNKRDERTNRTWIAQTALGQYQRIPDLESPAKTFYPVPDDHDFLTSPVAIRRLLSITEPV